MYLSDRMQAVQQPIIPIVGELIRQHPGTISLGQGVVHYGPPAEAIERIGQFLAIARKPQVQAGRRHRRAGHGPGTEAGRSKTASAPPTPAGLCVTAGGNMAFFNALLAIADPGDEIILLAPYYFNHEMAVAMLNCRPVVVPLDANYQLDLAAIRAAITRRTRAIVTISPNNPSGAVYPREALAAVNELCREHGIYHINDEAYEYFVYDRRRALFARLVAGAAAHTISLYSLSKAYGLASWRIGYMVIPEALDRGGPQGAGHDPDLPARDLAARGARELWRRRPSIAATTWHAWRRCRQMVLAELDAVRCFCTIPPALGAFYFLLRVDTPLPPMEVGRAADRRVRRGGDSRHDLRHAAGLLSARGLRRARRGYNSRGHRAAGARA